MNDIYSLLSINKDIFQEFQFQYNLLDEKWIEKVIDRNIRSLKRIEDMCSPGEYVPSKPLIINAIANKVRKSLSLSNADKTRWNPMELRTMSYNLSVFKNSDKEFEFVLQLLDDNWRYPYLNGLIFYLLNYWNDPPIEYRKQVASLVYKKLRAYDGDIKRYVMLKNHSDLFEMMGPMRMAKLLSVKNLYVEEAPSIIGYRSSVFQYSYFSDVVYHYIKYKHITDLSVIESILDKHGLTRTKKLIFADLVEEADLDGTEIRQTQVSKFARRKLGDISLSSTWAPFEGATEDEKLRLEHAKELVNRWYARRVISVFFDTCVQDRERKKFWLGFEGYIRDFRVVGSNAIKLNLSGDNRINDIIGSYFITTNSRALQTAALVLYIKDKVFVEFSDVGALYIYNQNNVKIRYLNNRSKRYIDSINDLKQPKMSSIVDYFDYTINKYNDEGKMVHSGYWKERLTAWIKNKMGIEAQMIS